MKPCQCHVLILYIEIAMMSLTDRGQQNSKEPVGHVCTHLSPTRLGIFVSATYEISVWSYTRGEETKKRD